MMQQHIPVAGHKRARSTDDASQEPTSTSTAVTNTLLSDLRKVVVEQLAPHLVGINNNNNKSTVEITTDTAASTTTIAANNNSPPSIERIPSVASVTAIVPTMNLLGQMLLGGRIEIVVRESKEEQSLNVTTTDAFDLVEVEAYVLGPKHNDTFTHADPQQSLFGTFYFHRMGPGKSYKGGSFKGMDITLGSNDVGAPSCATDATSHKKQINAYVANHQVGDDEAASTTPWAMACPFYASYLVRSLRNVKTGEVIEGPSLVVDALLTAAGAATAVATGGGSATATNVAISSFVDATGREFLSCDGTAKNTLNVASFAGNPLSTVSMRLVPNPNTPPTVVGSIATKAVYAPSTTLSHLLNPPSMPSHILTGPRVGLIPRTFADLRYGGALYRYINSSPNAAGGEPVVQKKGGSKKAGESAKDASSSAALVQLAKVRSGVVAAMVLKRILLGQQADETTSVFATRCRAVTGATNSSITAIMEQVEKVCLLHNQNQNEEQALIIQTVGRQILLGGGAIPLSSQTSTASTTTTTPEIIKKASQVINAILGQDVKKAEVISVVTALYGCYVSGGLGLTL